MEEMEKLGSVSSEGGPLLVVEAAAGGSWRGISADDYERACTALDAASPGGAAVVRVGDRSGIVWDRGGAGTADVFRWSGGLVLVRWWGPDVESGPPVSTLGVEAGRRAQVGVIDVSLPLILILWATEDGRDIIGLPAPAEGPVVGDLSVDGSGLVAGCEPGRYEVVEDEFSVDGYDGLRCWLMLCQ